MKFKYKLSLKLYHNFYIHIKLYNLMYKVFFIYFSSSFYLRGKRNFSSFSQTCIVNYKPNVFTPKVTKEEGKARD